jgi:putative transposase
MNTYTQLLYQIVFSTKNRDKTLSKDNPEALFKGIWGILKNKKCHLYRNQWCKRQSAYCDTYTPDDILSSLVKDIKVGSSTFIKANKF